MLRIHLRSVLVPCFSVYSVGRFFFAPIVGRFFFAPIVGRFFFVPFVSVPFRRSEESRATVPIRLFSETGPLACFGIAEMERVGLDQDRFYRACLGNGNREEQAHHYSSMISEHNPLSMINSLFPDNTRDTGKPCRRPAAYATKAKEENRMKAKMGNSLRIARLLILPGIALFLSACEKPKLRSDGSNFRACPRRRFPMYLLSSQEPPFHG